VENLGIKDGGCGQLEHGIRKQNLVVLQTGLRKNGEPRPKKREEAIERTTKVG